MAQEAQAQAPTLAGTLDDAGNVGHHKRLLVAVAHNAQRRLHRRERVVRYLRLRIAQGRHQRRLAGIGEAHQSHVGQQLQLQDDRHLLHRLTRLRIARSLVRGAAELEVAQSSATAFQQHDHLAVVRHVAHVLSRLGVIHHRTAGHVDVDVLAVRAVTLVPTAVAPVLRKDVALVLQVQQRPVVMIPAQVDVATPAAVAPVGAAVRVILHVLQVHRPLAALARAAQYLHIVYEVALHLSYSLSTRTRYFVGIAVRHVGLDDAVVLLCSRDTQS